MATPLFLIPSKYTKHGEEPQSQPPHKDDSSNILTVDILIKFIKDNFGSDGQIEPIKVEESLDKEELKPLSYNTSSNLTNLDNSLKILFKDFLTSMCRYGSISSIISKDIENSSLVFSILSCYIDEFLFFDNKQQISYIKTFISTLSSALQGEHFEKFGYKDLGWNKKSLLEDIDKGMSHNCVIRFIADYLHVNIFIIDVNEDKVYQTGGHEFVPFKKSFFLIKIDNNYEPVFINDKKFISYEDDLLKYLLKNNENVEVFDLYLKRKTKTDYIKPVFKVSNEQLEKYLTKKEIKIDYETRMLESQLQYSFNKANIKNTFSDEETKKLSDKKEDSSIFIKTTSKTKIKDEDDTISINTDNDNKNDNDKKNILNDYSKMKVEQLKIIALEKGLSIYKTVGKTKKLKLKSELIEELTNIM